MNRHRHLIACLLLASISGFPTIALARGGGHGGGGHAAGGHNGGVRFAAGNNGGSASSGNGGGSNGHAMNGNAGAGGNTSNPLGSAIAKEAQSRNIADTGLRNKNIAEGKRRMGMRGMRGRGGGAGTGDEANAMTQGETPNATNWGGAQGGSSGVPATNTVVQTFDWSRKASAGASSNASGTISATPLQHP